MTDPDNEPTRVRPEPQELQVGEDPEAPAPRLSNANLEALLYHGCSSGTPTPPMVRDGLVKACVELQQRRAADLTATEVAEARDLIAWVDDLLKLNPDLGAHRIIKRLLEKQLAVSHGIDPTRKP